MHCINRTRLYLWAAWRGLVPSVVLPGTVMRLIRYAILQPSLCCVFAFAVSTHRKLLDILLTDAEHVLVFFPVLKPDFTYKFSITAYTSRIPFKNLATQSKWFVKRIFVEHWIERFLLATELRTLSILRYQQVMHQLQHCRRRESFFIAQLCNSIMGHEHKRWVIANYCLDLLNRLLQSSLELRRYQDFKIIVCAKPKP